MKNLKRLWLPLFSLLLVSCGGGSSSSISNQDDYTLPYFDRNGDLFAQESAASNGYSTLGRPASYLEVKGQIEDIAPVFALLHSTTCSHCIKLESLFVNFALASKLEIYVFDVTGGTSELNSLAQAFPDYSETLTGIGTPSIYYFKNSTEVEYLDFYSHTNSLSDLEFYLYPTFNLTSIYHFRTYAGYEAYKKEAGDNLIVTVDSGDSEARSFYDFEIRSQARHSQKSVALIEWNRLSEEDQSSFKKELGITTASSYLFKENGVYSTPVDYLSSEDPTAAITAYFSA